MVLTSTHASDERPAHTLPLPHSAWMISHVSIFTHSLLASCALPHDDLQVAVKLLTVDTEEPAVLDAFLKEVALCACLRGCNRVVRLLGACLGGVGAAATPPTPTTAAATMAGTVAAPSAAMTASTAVGAAVAVAAATSSSSSSSQAQPVALPTAGDSSNGWMDARELAALVNGDRSASAAEAAAAAMDGAAAVGGAAAVTVSTVADGGLQQQHQQPHQQLALIMELVEGGNLAQRIYHPSKRRLTYLEVRGMLRA